MIEGLFQPTHLILILIIVLIVFGPGKLPEIGSALGKSIREFRTTARDEAAGKGEEKVAERTTTSTTSTATAERPAATRETTATAERPATTTTTHETATTA